MEKLLKVLVDALVVDEKAVTIESRMEGKLCILKVNVSDSDVGRVIGKEGKIANALSTVVRSVGMKKTPDIRYVIKINDGKRK